MRLIETIIICYASHTFFGIFLNLTHGRGRLHHPYLLRVVVGPGPRGRHPADPVLLSAGVVARRNPIKVLLVMTPAYLTALATPPLRPSVTLRCDQEEWRVRRGCFLHHPVVPRSTWLAQP